MHHNHIPHHKPLVDTRAATAIASIDMARTLDTKRDRSRVEARLRAWAKQHSMVNMPNPNLIEARWSDDFKFLYINKECGLPAFFDSMFREHQPVAEDQHWAIYDDKNPAAFVVLEAIKEVTHLREAS